MRGVAKAHRSTRNDHLNRIASLGSCRSTAMTLGMISLPTRGGGSRPSTSATDRSRAARLSAASSARASPEVRAHPSIASSERATAPPAAPCRLWVSLAAVDGLRAKIRTANPYRRSGSDLWVQRELKRTLPKTLTGISIAEFARQWHLGELTIEATVQDYLIRIDKLDPRLGAFEFVAAEFGTGSASALDRTAGSRLRSWAADGCTYQDQRSVRSYWDARDGGIAHRYCRPEGRRGELSS